MKKFIFSVVLLVITTSIGFAQNRFQYRGKAINLANNEYQSIKICDLQGVKGQSYQGMDIWGDYIFSLQNTGVATIYKFNGSEAKKTSQFNLGSNAKTNHSNVASFSTQFFTKGDKFPLLFVSQCYNGVVDGMKDVIYVEHITNDMKSSELVAIINFNDPNHLCGYAVQWVVDRQNGYLYGFANTVANLDENNKHRVLKFKLPIIAQSSTKTAKKKKTPTTPVVINLTENDLIENYLIEESFSKYYKQIGQGLFVKNGQLFMPVGLGTKDHPSILYVWDLAKHSMRNVLDLSASTSGELEDCSEYQGDLLIQTQGSLYRLIF